MNYDDKMKQIIEVNKIRSNLIKVGALGYSIGPTGPTGPSGKGLEIEGTYNSLAELKNEHPTGTGGECYLINGELYIWNQTINDWTDIGNIKGEKGDKGDKGDIGPTGPKGDIGDIGPTHTLKSESKEKVL